MRVLAFLFAVGVLSRAGATEASLRMLLLDGALAGPAVVVVGERGAVFRSTDEARTWRAVAVPTRATLTGISFAANGQTGWMVGHDAVILVTTNGGQTWEKQFQGENLQDSFLDVFALDQQHAIAIGAYGLCVRTDDGGKAWTRQKLLADDYHLNRLSRGPTGALYLAGEHGTLLRSNDNGVHWTAIAAPYQGSFYGILPLDPRTLLAYGLRGRVYRSVDDGGTWQLVATPEAALLESGVVLKGNTVLLAGSARTVWSSLDYGKTVVAKTWPATGFSGGVAEILELPNGSLLTLGEAGATLHARPQ